MNAAFIKTLSLLLLIVVGYLFQNKIKNKDQREGIKTLILSLALPATILIALLQINFQSNLIIIPIMSLGFNIILYLLIDKIPLQPVFNIPLNQYRTLIMLIPSLAPGLSCFPFIIEYSGPGPLAMAALADVGNKIFVLIISYTIAMKWYLEVNREHAATGQIKIKDMFINLINEPVNMVILIAIAMLSFGLTYQTFPETITLTIDRLSIMMTPLILLFIGLSMRLEWQQVKTIFSFLFLRSGIAFALSGMTLSFLHITDIPTTLLIIVFPQSACSFWPYAHMATVGQIENNLPGERNNKTFDLDFAMNVLACSMPFSVILIMVIYASGDFFARTTPVYMCSGAFLLMAAGMALLSMRILPFNVTDSLKMPSKIESVENQAS